MKCDKYNFLSNCSAKTCAHIHRVGVKYDKKLAMWWCKVKDKLYYSFNFLMDWLTFRRTTMDGWLKDWLTFRSSVKIRMKRVK